MRLLVAALTLVASPTVAITQQPRGGLDTARGVSMGVKIPSDPKVRIGTLPNGLRYYIRQNVKPEKRAELRLAVNAGSILEKPEQRGYAHFVEHTAFNGTKNFPKNDLVKYLQSIGIRLGNDLNAGTSFDETVYILPIPTDTARVVDQAFLILEDWAHGQVFDPTEVINERGVVNEELRGRKGAGDRMQQKYLPIALKGSLYADRSPGGTEATIMGATANSLRPFYRDWYRPDLMAVIAVGDFNVDSIEAKIKKHFSGLRKPANAPPRPVVPIPGNTAPLIAIASDKEATQTSVSLFFKLPRTGAGTVGDYRSGIMEELYFAMINGRFGEIVQKPDAPFLGAGASKGGFPGRVVDPFSLGAAVKDGGVERGLEALLLEAKRVDQFGFLQSELDRAKTNLLRGYERAHAERDKTNSYVYADEYLSNFFEGEPIPGIEYEYTTVQQLLPGITLADVNHLAQGWITEENRVVLITGPDKQGVPMPAEAQVLAVFDKATKTPVVAWTESVSADALVETLRPAGTIVSTKPRPVGVSEWTLSNGARVLIKVTDFKADQILLGAYSPGGIGSVSDADFMSGLFATQIMNLSGLGQFNRIDLGKKLAGKAAAVVPTIFETYEGFDGSASPRDLETMLQLLYLNFTAPRLDTVAFAAFKSSAGPFLANRSLAPESHFGDTIQVTMAQGDVRARPLSPQLFAEVDPKKSLAIFKDRFADASDFTFVLVGNVDTVALKPLVERYIASLPRTGRVDAPKVSSKGFPTGVVDKIVRRGIEPKANTVVAFTGACTYTPENRLAIRAMVDAMELRLLENLREKLGGAYSPSISGGCARTPRTDYQIRISFQSSPENVDLLSRTVLAIVDSMKTQGPPEADVVKVREQILRGREVETKQNEFWRNNIRSRDQAGEDIGGLGPAYDEMVRKVSVQSIQAAARQYLNTGNYARFRLLPETKAP